MSNKTIGNKFEQDLCEILSDNGFWVHNMMMSKAGQPADIIAVRNGEAYLIDAKVCSNNEFPFKRIEENQTLAMNLWTERGNGDGWFSLKLNQSIYMIPHIKMKVHSQYQSKLSAEEIQFYGIPIERWVESW